MNGALRRLRKGDAVFGVMQTVSASALTELALWSGFEFVILDCEHGVVDEQAQFAAIQIISASDAFSVVRVRGGDFAAVGRYLDFGADAILMADLKTPVDAAAFVSAATFGPKGTRSSAGSSSRETRYGIAGKGKRAKPLLLTMLETSEALTNVTEIAATPGIDGLVIGPHDLSADLGCPGDFSAPSYKAAFVKIEKAALNARIIVGSVPHPGFSADRLLKAGHRFILASADVIALRDGYRAHLAAVGRSATS